MMRALLFILLLLLGTSFVMTARVWHIRASLPYNEAGRHFENGVMYHEQSVGVYAAITFCSLALTLLFGVGFWRINKTTK